MRIVYCVSCLLLPFFLATCGASEKTVQSPPTASSPTPPAAALPTPTGQESPPSTTMRPPPEPNPHEEADLEGGKEESPPATSSGEPPELIRILRFPPYGPNKMAISASGEIIAADVMTRIRKQIEPIYGAVLWDLATGKQIRVLEHAPTRHGGGSTWSLAFSPSGTYLASGNAEGTVTIWNTRTGAVERTLRISEKAVVEGVRFSPDEKTLAAGTTGGEIQLWDLRNGTLLRKLT